MLRSHLKVALLTTAVAAAVIAPATAASAASSTVKDGSGDVWMSAYDDASGTMSWSAAGSVANVDLVSSTVNHGLNKVFVKMQYTDLTKSGERFVPSIQMRFDNGPKRVAFIDTYAGWGGKHMLFKDGTNSNSAVPCSGFTHTIDYTANTVSMAIPRSCLGSPAWLEANVRADAAVSDDPTGNHAYLDSALSSGHPYAKYGARLKRG